MHTKSSLQTQLAKYLIVCDALKLFAESKGYAHATIIFEQDKVHLVSARGDKLFRSEKVPLQEFLDFINRN